MLKDDQCIELCLRKHSRKQVEDFKWMIDRDYHYTLYIDELPSAYVSEGQKNSSVIKYENGIPIGKYNRSENKYYIFNHLEMTVQIHETMDD